MTLGAAGVRELLDEVASAPELYRPSAFWDELVALGLKQIEGSGLENFKRSVNMAYFNWGVVGILRHQLLPVLAAWCRRPRLRVLGARFPDHRTSAPGTGRYHAISNFRIPLAEVASFGPVSAFVYRTYVAMLWEHVRSIDALGLLASLDEPRFGNPFLVRYQGREISQDLCNSVHEFYSSGASAAASGGRPIAIAELGGGYGRLADVCLKALPACTYTLVDIAPALNVAQEYLTRVFPGERIFYFRPFRDFEEVRSEFLASRIRFLAAHQVERLPAKQFDLFVNVSSLHEMTRPQIENYLRQIDRLCRGRFYTKQWRVSEARVTGHVIREHEYPIPPSWRRVYHRRHPVQRLFFEALYDVGGA